MTTESRGSVGSATDRTLAVSVFDRTTASERPVMPGRRGCGTEVGAALLMHIVRLELLLQRQDLLVALVQPRRQRDHDVALLQQQLLVPVHLRACTASHETFVVRQGAGWQRGHLRCRHQSIPARLRTLCIRAEEFQVQREGSTRASRMLVSGKQIRACQGWRLLSRVKGGYAKAAS